MVDGLQERDNNTTAWQRWWQGRQSAAIGDNEASRAVVAIVGVGGDGSGCCGWLQPLVARRGSRRGQRGPARSTLVAAASSKVDTSGSSKGWQPRRHYQLRRRGRWCSVDLKGSERSDAIIDLMSFDSEKELAAPSLQSTERQWVMALTGALGRENIAVEATGGTAPTSRRVSLETHLSVSPRLVAWPLGTGAVRQPPQPRRDGASSHLLCARLRRAGAVSWRRPRRIDSLHARQNDDDGDDDDEQQCSSSPRPHRRWMQLPR
ncbi:hypothetical protein BHE74_00036316 [Ensete ventricosum]|nr:hypothetical protein BHE74_00036316 [Ensete ventricosum]